MNTNVAINTMPEMMNALLANQEVIITAIEGTEDERMIYIPIGSVEDSYHGQAELLIRASINDLNGSRSVSIEAEQALNMVKKNFKRTVSF